MNYIRLSIFLFFLSTTSSAQEVKNQLTVDEISQFKNELIFNYQLYYESVLNILNSNLDIYLRNNSRLVLLDLFANTNSVISEYFNPDIKESLPISEYSMRLLNHVESVPIFYKEFKFGDSISISKPISAINSKYIGLGKEERNSKIYKSYYGQLFFLEKTIYPKIRKKNYSIDIREDLKVIKFKIKQNDFDFYNLEIKSIDIVEKNNRAYDYKSLSKDILSSSQKWSNESNEHYVKEILTEAKEKGIILSLSIDDLKRTDLAINLPKITKLDFDYKYKILKPYELIIPGFGHRKFGTPLWDYFYGGIFVASISYAVYNGIEKNNELMVNSLQLSLLSVVINSVHLSLKETNNRRKIEFQILGGLVPNENSFFGLNYSVSF